jgi:transposase InsO family protein
VRRARGLAGRLLAWRSRPESERSAANRELVEDIRRVHRDTCGRYGSPRNHVELKAQGRGVSRGRIERLMRHHGIRAIMARPRRVRTTDSRHDLPIAPNLLGRNFFAAAPNRIWLADITYVETDQAGSIWPPSWTSTAAGSSAGRASMSRKADCYTLKASIIELGVTRPSATSARSRWS